jgi:hypothetical protein
MPLAESATDRKLSLTIACSFAERYLSTALFATA